MKKLALGIGSLLILLIAVALVAPSFMDWNKYKTEAQTQIKTLTGHDVALNGDLSISLLPAPKAYVRDIVVKAVPGAKAAALASVERVDLHLAILPLFSGKVAITQVSFVKPVIAIETLADGRQSWQTPELDALMNKSDAASQTPAAPQDQAAAQTASGMKSSGFDISVQNFTVEDGSFSFFDKAKGSEIVLSGVNLALGAESFSGPFTGRGSLNWNGQAVDFDLQSGRFGGGADSVAVNAHLGLSDALSLDYAGVAGVTGGLDLQGETSLKIIDLQALAKVFGADLGSLKAASLELKGVLNATPQAVSMKDLTFDLAGDKFTGALDGALAGDAPSVKAVLTAEKPVNLDNILNIKPSAGGSGASDSILGGGGQEGAGKSGFLPEKITLPELAFSAVLKAPALIYKGEEYRSVTLSLANAKAGASLGLDIGAIPGQGALAVTASLKAQDAKAPSLAVSVKGGSKNLPYTLEALNLGLDPKTVEGIKAASLDVDASLYNDRVDFENSNVTIDGTLLAFSGSYAPGKSGGKPSLRLNLAAGALDVNKIMAADDGGAATSSAQGTGGEAESGASSPDIKLALGSLALPFDFDFDLSAESLIYQDYNLKGLAASGQWVKNTLALSGLSVKDFAGASLQAKGKVDNIQTLSGVDLTLGAQSSDVKALAQVLKLDTSSLPSNLGRTDISAALKGNADNLNVLANVKALNGEVIVQGAVANPLGSMKADKLSLQVKHRSVSEAINIFSPGRGSYASLNGPLDFYTDVQIADNVTSLNNIKARLAGTSLQGQMSVNTGSSVPDVTGSLVFDDLVVQSSGVSSAAGRADGSSSGSALSSSAAGPQWSREAIDTAWMRAVNFDLSLSGNSLKYEGWDLSKPVIKASLKDGTLKVEQMDAGMFQGQIAMTASVQSGKGERQPLQIEADAKIRDVSLEPLVKAFVGVPLIKGSGLVSMDNTISASGISPAALVYDLGGNGTITGKNIVIEGLDLTRFAKALSTESKPGDTALGIWKGATKGGSTAFDTLDGGYTIQEGVINISKLDLDGPKAAIATTGKIDLPKWTIDTAHNITVKGEETPPFTVKLSGSLSNPANTFGQGILEDYLQRKLGQKLQDKLGNKLDGKLGGVINNILGGGAATTTTTTTTTPATTTQQPVQTQTQAPAAVNDNTVPAASGTDATTQGAGETAQPSAAQSAEQPQQIKPEDAMKGLLKGLLQQ